jgi:hypothetical protein
MIGARASGLFLAFAAAFICSAGVAHALDETRLKRFFDLMDLDGDQLVSRPEFQSGKGVVFLTMDLDGSMTLTADEMRLTPEAFKLLAGDDGVVDGEEFIASDMASFEAIDSNQDHELDFAELKAYIAKYSN